MSGRLLRNAGKAKTKRFYQQKGAPKPKAYTCRFCPAKGMNKSELEFHLAKQHDKDVAGRDLGYREVKRPAPRKTLVGADEGPRPKGIMGKFRKMWPHEVKDAAHRARDGGNRPTEAQLNEVASGILHEATDDSGGSEEFYHHLVKTMIKEHRSKHGWAPTAERVYAQEY